MSFNFLKDYIVQQEGKREFKHNFYKVNKEQLQEIKSLIKIPYELNLFYQEIGYGFMFDINELYSINKFLDPDGFKKINYREDYFQFDPTLNLFDNPEYEGKLIFFEVNEGVYLLIDKDDTNGKNAIYYFDHKIADSLEEFLLKFDSNPNLINEIE